MGVELGFEHVAARPKKADDDAAPTQQPMRSGKPIARNPSTDQKRVRREMARSQQQSRTATHEESCMPTESDLLAKIASAGSRAEQRQYAAELEAMRASKSASRRAERELDLSNTVIESRFERMPETTASTRHTAASDWLNDVEPSGADTVAVERHMRAQANLWFDRQQVEAKNDMDEITARAHAWARREASQFGEASAAGYEAAIGQIEHLHGRHVATMRAQADVNATQPLADTHIDTGSSLPKGVVNKDTFDDSLFAPAGQADPKTTTSAGDAPSLAEGTQPEGDAAQGIEEPAANNTHAEDNKDTSATDYLDGQKYPASNGTGATFSSRKVADDQTSQSWDGSATPSLAEGGPIAGDQAQGYAENLADDHDASNGAGTATDYLDGSTYPKQGSLARLAASIEADEASVGHAVTPRALPFLAAMKALPSKAASIGGVSGEAVIRYFLAAADLRGPKAAQHVAVLTQVLANGFDYSATPSVIPLTPARPGGGGDYSDGFGGGLDHTFCDHAHGQCLYGPTSYTPSPWPQPLSNGHDDEGAGVGRGASKTAADADTCSTCGDSIESDPDGSWHHNNGEKHDHEADPDNKKTSATEKCGAKGPVAPGGYQYTCTLDKGHTTVHSGPGPVGGDLGNSTWGKAKTAAWGDSDEYANTPVFDKEQARPGMFVHIGGGQFAARCPTCNVIETGDIGHLNSWTQRHAWDAHKTDLGPMLPPSKSSSRTAGEYGGGSPKEGDTAKCHKDGGAIQFFDGQWMHLKGTGSSHNDVYPATPKEQADKDKTAAVDTSRLAAFRQRVAANLGNL